MRIEDRDLARSVQWIMQILQHVGSQDFLIQVLAAAVIQGEPLGLAAVLVHVRLVPVFTFWSML